MPWTARLYIGFVCALGAALAAQSLAVRQSEDLARFLCYLFIALLASGFKVQLPGIKGTMSVNFLFILIGIVQMTLAETVVIGCLGTLIQCLWKPKRRLKAVEILFSVADIAIAVVVSYRVYHSAILRDWNHGSPALLVITALCFFFLNTAAISTAISLTEGKPVLHTWHNCYFWSFPFYLVGASIAWIISVMSQQIRWQGSILLLPIIFIIYRSYRMYLDRLQDEKRHVEQMAGLHLRTIEALALAIEAKDHTTHDHLRRVRTYAVEIGRELALPPAGLEALRAAALLHDIGKLAVPEHIISKPGRLSPEEFEKMKIHPLVGAEILERVEFPYPVVPIVRAHHEHWDGTGYPYGLKGEQIPLGARILAAVDCLDALASDRQYRRALRLEQAMEHIASLSGTSFDPAVVEVLLRRFREFDQMTQEQPMPLAKLSTTVKVEKGPGPAAGYALPVTGEAGLPGGDFLASIAAARQEVQLLFELTQDLGNSLSLDETLSVLAVRLKRMAPYDAIVVYVLRNGVLIPEYVNGENFRLFSSLEIPVGQGLSGWVAENGKPIINGDPSVESGYMHDPEKHSTLRSALSVPLEGVNGAVGVLTLYRAEKDAFSQDHLRMLLAISSKIALSIENALKFQQVESSATTDYLTGLPNARSLFLRLDADLSRSKRTGEPLAVLVCDLDGFKLINDRYGHLEGNKVLRYLADALRQNCREYDYVARMGGDEFVVLLSASDREAVYGRIPQLAQLARDAGWLATGSDLLSLSVGEAFYPEDGADAEQLLAEADRRMYKNKSFHKKQRGGRPAVRAAEPVVSVVQ